MSSSPKPAVDVYSADLYKADGRIVIEGGIMGSRRGRQGQINGKVVWVDRLYIDLIMELLKDPGNTRVFKGLPLPPSRPLRS